MKTMCQSIKTLSKVKSGTLFFCSQCDIYHLEFNNIYLKFSRKEFEQFKAYIQDIEIDYWECKHASTRLKRKIHIPSMQQNLVLMFKHEEIKELHILFTTSTKDVFNSCLEIAEIDYKFILN